MTPTLEVTTVVANSLPCANIPPLAFLLLADRLGELYEIVFPDRPQWLTAEPLNWESEEDIAAAVERFLQRVNGLFPVHDDIWDVDIEDVEWRLYEIPVILMGYDEWYDGWDDLKEPVPYLLHMCYSRRDDGTSSERDEFTDLYPDQHTPQYLDPHQLMGQRFVDTLRQTCAERSRRMDLAEPLNALPDLILMLGHNTGNIWLDVGEISLAEGGGYPQWNPDDVAWLAEEWQKAEPILDSIQRLLDWQNDTPDAIDNKLTAVHDVLLAAYHRAEQSEEITTEVMP